FDSSHSMCSITPISRILIRISRIQAALERSPRSTNLASCNSVLSSTSRDVCHFEGAGTAPRVKKTGHVYIAYYYCVNERAATAAHSHAVAPDHLRHH